MADLTDAELDKIIFCYRADTKAARMATEVRRLRAAAPGWRDRPTVPGESHVLQAESACRDFLTDDMLLPNVSIDWSNISADCARDLAILARQYVRTQDAVAAETERCAALAESHKRPAKGTVIAAAIRRPIPADTKETP